MFGGMLKSTAVKEALASAAPRDALLVQGWVRTRRDAKTFSFLEVNDGSCLKSLQVIADAALANYAEMQHLITGASVVRARPARGLAGPGAEMGAQAPRQSTVVGPADATYPLQKKGHTPEFLREIAHLRPRSNLFGAVFRMRSRLAFAVHQFFQERGFVYVHTPIITGSDCEGAGEMFRVTTLDLEAPPKRPTAKSTIAKDFFGRPTYLTVSGQLEAEAFACALSKVYTFGPTFRAENSNTSRHASEFWMIEPEMAFCDLAGDMDLAEEFVKALIREVRTHCAEDLELFAKFVDKELLRAPRLRRWSGRSSGVSYTEAVEMLDESGHKLRVPGRIRHESPVGARALPDRGALQVPGDRLQLSQGDQTVLHAAERRREDGRRPWTCWCRASARSSAAASARSGWTCSRRACGATSSIPRITAGTWTCGATARCRTPASAWVSSAC